MKSLKEFLNESNYKLYRGYAQGSDPFGKAPFIWFSTSYKHANNFANQEFGSSKTREGEILEYSFTPKNPVNFRDADRRITIKEFMSEAIKQTKINPKQIKDEYIKLRKELIKTYGNKTKFIHQFWYDDKQVAKFIDLLGFDSILAKEQNIQTVGILRKYVK